MQDKKESKKEKAVISKSAINANCLCDEPNCPRHGKCSECQDYHKKHPECGKTACGR